MTTQTRKKKSAKDAVNEPVSGDTTRIPMKTWLVPSRVNFFCKPKAEGEMALGRYMEVELENKVIQDIFARTFEPASRDSYLVTVRAPQEFSKRMTSSIYKEDEILGAEKAISEHEKLLNEFLDLHTTQTIQRLSTAGYDPTTFTRAFKVYEAKVVTSTMSGLISLYKKADYLYTIYNALWIFGELGDTSEESNKAWRQFERSLRQNLHAFSATISKQSSKVRSLLHRLLQERQSFRFAQSKRDSQVKKGGEFVLLSTTPESDVARADRQALVKNLPEIVRQLEEAVGVGEDVVAESELDVEIMAGSCDVE